MAKQVSSLGHSWGQIVTVQTAAFPPGSAGEADVADMNTWMLLLLLLLGFAQDIPFLVHEVTAKSTTPATSSSIKSSPAATTNIDRSQAITNTSSSDAPINETTSAASSVSPAPTGSTLITSNSIEISSIATGSAATTMVTGSKEPHTSRETSPTSPSTAAAQASKEPSLAQSPGLVAVICIFVSVLLIAGVVMLVKFCHRREPAFKKLDEVPMQGKVAEDSPFARYPPK
ncbi:hypothetical protein lerEdw1_008513 [Lerista edwardsae]|nr:hypothetical protein lerEdw1_008513 [Lerista edwardsae]